MSSQWRPGVQVRIFPFAVMLTSLQRGAVNDRASLQVFCSLLFANVIQQVSFNDPVWGLARPQRAAREALFHGTVLLRPAALSWLQSADA